MRSRILTADSAGKILSAGGPGVGFALFPAVGAGAPAAARPGSYPVTVRIRGEGEAFEVANGHVYVREIAFMRFDIEGLEAGDTWQVVTLEHERDVLLTGAQRSRVGVAIQGTAAAVPTVAPTLATEGYKIRPGTLRHSFYFTGTLTNTITIWQRSRSGSWVASGETIDPSTEPIATRSVFSAADRIYLRSSASGTNVEIDADCEVG